MAYRAAKASDAARAIAQAATQAAERVRRRGRASAKSEFFYQLALQCERIAVDAASAAARAYKITLTRAGSDSAIQASLAAQAALRAAQAALDATMWACQTRQ